jgi:hypothetical protein
VLKLKNVSDTKQGKNAMKSSAGKNAKTDITLYQKNATISFYYK